MERPRHRQYRKYAGLFSGLTSAKELERRISSLPTPKERGDAFEVFAEAYLVLMPNAQTSDVWPFESIPKKFASKLAIDTARDMGVDGLLESTNGDFEAYQVKYRRNRKPLNWEELSTFMGLTDKVRRRVLFTNSNSLPDLMNSRSGFYCIRGVDLDRLERRDFIAIESWLADQEPTYRVKSPLPHQQCALDDILPALMESDRATAVMACGTGKTLVALWAAQQINAESVIVFVPSLALIRQTFHEWLKEASWRAAYLCVCSDTTVKNIDGIDLKQSDLDFPVTTDPAVISEFLDSASPRKIVFTTYQSAEAISVSCQGGFAFDMGIFDEAHKTAGREGAKFSFPLKNKNIPITKRLFLTATPRHYLYRKYKSGTQRRAVYSMDDDEVYGKRAHTLSFGEAARHKIICSYKIIVSVVTSDMVDTEMRKQGEVLVKGEVVHAQQVANQIALKKAIEESGAQRIFTFHSSVKSAKSFVADGGEGVGSHLPDFDTFHVNGAMNTAMRDSILVDFREANKAIISNARCLTEGVDLPAVDMVAFVSPKKSKVDIVQAVGRAMRKADDKEYGYVLLPLYVELGREESVEEALDRTGFADIWHVLRAMQDQDEELAETISEIRVERGKDKKGFDDFRLREKLKILGPELQLHEIEECVSARIIDQFGVEWMPFTEARKFARSLGLSSVDVWKLQYCRGLMPSLPEKPLGVPRSPHAVYKNDGWESWGDWLGTGNVSSQDWIPFEEARAFARKLGLKSSKQWIKYIKGARTDLQMSGGPIPSRPDGIYKDEWVNWSDFLGSSTRRNVKWREFSEARNFVRSLNFKNLAEWKAYVDGERKDLPALPSDIPRTPARAYANDGWNGAGDWLGSGFVSNSQRKYKNFSEARDWVRKLGLKKQDDWKNYINGDLKNLPLLPSDIPKAPSHYYKENWRGMSDWLGVERARPGEWRDFEEARTFARSLGFKYRKQWAEYSKNNIEGLEKPSDIPSHPDSCRAYKDKWISFEDWLGIELVEPREFELAREFVRALKLQKVKDWAFYCRGELSGFDEKPIDIPSSPQTTYRDKGWISMRDWLGLAKLGSTIRKRSFSDAREFVRSLGLRGANEWRSYCSGEFKDLPKLPSDIPRTAPKVYKDAGWAGWPDFLGYTERKWMGFEEARAFARRLNFHSSAQWADYCRGRLRGLPDFPEDMPKNPSGTYEGSGWISWKDFLGKPSRSSQERRGFNEAKRFVQGVGLQTKAEWVAFCKGELAERGTLPADIPRRVDAFYKEEWKGWGDFLGTGRIATFDIEYMPFRQARDFVRSLGLKSGKDWASYCKGDLADLPPKPGNIPNNPNHVYKETGWISMTDWHGEGRYAKNEDSPNLKIHD